jgi:hypothetical protein
MVEIAGEAGAGVLFTFGLRAIAITVVLEITAPSLTSEVYSKINRLIIRAMVFFAVAFILLTQSRF